MLAGDFLRESANFTPELASSGNAKLDEINKASASFMKKVPGLNGGVDRTITNNCAMQAQSIKAINGASSLQIIVDFYVAGIAKDSKTKNKTFKSAAAFNSSSELKRGAFTRSAAGSSFSSKMNTLRSPTIGASSSST